jgi:hypothetical protein
MACPPPWVRVRVRTVQLRVEAKLMKYRSQGFLTMVSTAARPES